MAGLGCGLVGITGRGVSRMDARSVFEGLERNREGVVGKSGGEGKGVVIV